MNQKNTKVQQSQRFLYKKIKMKLALKTDSYTEEKLSCTCRGVLSADMDVKPTISLK